MILSVVVSNFIKSNNIDKKTQTQRLSYHSINCLASKMSKLNDIVTILESVSPPHRLLTAHDNHYIPLYSLQAFQALDKPFHMGVGLYRMTGCTQKRGNCDSDSFRKYLMNGNMRESIQCSIVTYKHSIIRQLL